MANEPKRDVAEPSKDLLLAEHRYLADSFWRNEEAGEKRVNFFITLVTAVLAALVTLATKQGSLTDGQVAMIAFASCLSLVGVGTLTFRRLIHRNRVTDRYKLSMDHIRDQFRLWDPTGLDGYDPFPKGGGMARSFGRGGLTDLVAIVNSVIGATAVAALVAVSGSLAATAIAAACSVVLFIAAHAAYLEHSYQGTWLHPLWRRLLVRRPNDRENESTLVIVSDAAGVLRTLEELREVAGYALGRAQLEKIRDRYLDTRDRALGKQAIALRVRELDGRELVTLKGPSDVGRWGGESRIELEREWSEQGWQEVQAELRRRGIDFGTVSARGSDGLDALEEAGLEIVQDREVTRLARDVRRTGGGDTVVAELALDTTTYHFASRDVRHHEVEIEAKTGPGDEAVAAIAATLVERYWPRLRPWRHGKLATGKAVAALLDGARAEEVVAGDGSLAPHAYDAIAALLDADGRPTGQA